MSVRSQKKRKLSHSKGEETDKQYYKRTKSILSLSEKDNTRNTETPGQSLTFNSTIMAGQHQHP